MTLALHDEVESLFRQKMLEFIAWAEASWKIEEADMKEGQWADDKSPDYREGFNAAIEGLKGAFECWNEECGP